MPKNKEIKKVLIIGAGPIVIGQACEFDYSGVQACRALREDGIEVVLVNSNPATIMTDQNIADRTYIEPLVPSILEAIIEKERPDALLSTMGGQTAINLTLNLIDSGVAAKYGLTILGANKEVIINAEDRGKFKSIVENLGYKIAKSYVVKSIEEATSIDISNDLPLIIRPSFTLGGEGGGIAYNKEEYIDICTKGLAASYITQILIEECLSGWKEYEMEIVNDASNNSIIVCTIENLDPIGIHTGDSITVAPSITLTDKEYYLMREASIKIARAVGVNTGGANIQFAVNPKNGDMIVIEMNPRVSRSSALASKATGFPIAKVAAKVAIGYNLSEITNDITGGKIASSFEPSLDYMVVKSPVFSFEKFKNLDCLLGTQMKSVGEAMAIGRNFKEALQKSLLSLDNNLNGFNSLSSEEDVIVYELRYAKDKRILYVADAFRIGLSLDHVQEVTGIDPWYLREIKEIVDIETKLAKHSLEDLNYDDLLYLKKQGLSDSRIAEILNTTESSVRNARLKLNIRPVYKRVDSCAGEFDATTSYMYSTYDVSSDTVVEDDRKKVLILGSGPNKIGQGIEFDYCCVHAAMELKESGYKAIMLNCNPETVSTDYDISDVLYFDPLTLEHVLSVIDHEKPDYVLLQFGGQTPLKLSTELSNYGIKVLGTSSESIDITEDREKFAKLINKLGLTQAANYTAYNLDEAKEAISKLDFPVLCRPSYVLGGRNMKIINNISDFDEYVFKFFSSKHVGPLLIDEFLCKSIEIDVDAVSDGRNVLIAGVLEHVEYAGIHSGDSPLSISPIKLKEYEIEELKRQAIIITKELNIIGCINIQFVVRNGITYVLEVNARGSRTIPFISKAIGFPFVKLATSVMLGNDIDEQYLLNGVPKNKYYAVKESAFSFHKLIGSDLILGPEMQSTGEVMGFGKTFLEAYAKAQLAVGVRFDNRCMALLSIADEDKPHLIPIAENLISLGFKLGATKGSADFLRSNGIEVIKVNKNTEGRPNIIDLIKDSKVGFILNTVGDNQSITDSKYIRINAMRFNIPLFTTISSAYSACICMESMSNMSVSPIQDIYNDSL